MDDSVPGYFGKLPCSGDFVSRGLPRSFVQPWDAWLSRALAASLARPGPGRIEDYLVSPFWRFVLSPGMCGDAAWSGVMMASVDRVGRAFPMTVARPASGASGPFSMLLDDTAWFGAVEDCLLGALRDDVDLPAFDRSLAALPPRAEAPPAPTGDAAAWRISLAGADARGVPLSPLLDHFANAPSRPCSCWTTTGSPTVAASLLVCPGLPPERHFGAFIDGDWRQAGWAELPYRRLP